MKGFPSTKKALPQVRHVRADVGYCGKAIKWIGERLGWAAEIVNRPRKWGWYLVDVEPEPLSSFKLLRRRRVVERTLAGLGRCRRLSRDYEYLIQSGGAFIYTAMIRLLLKQLTPRATG